MQKQISIGILIIISTWFFGGRRVNFGQRPEAVQKRCVRLGQWFYHSVRNLNFEVVCMRWLADWRSHDKRAGRCRLL